MDAEALNIYLICIVALTFNLLFLAGWTGVKRGQSKTYVNPEDAKVAKGTQAERDVDMVERVKAAHRNALENIPMFAILGLLYVMTGATKTGALAYFVTFTVARWLHSIMYLRGLQPFRTMMFAVGVLVIVGLSIQVLLVALA